MKDANEKLLEGIDDFIQKQARRVMCWHLCSGHEELDTLEVDELAQRVRIKLWKMLQKGPIQSPFSYTRRIIYSEFIDMKRQQKVLSPLPEDDSEEIHPLTPLVIDPADEIIARMEALSFLRNLVQMMVDLPARQKTAMLSFLWLQVDDTTVLQAILAAYDLEANVIEWPAEDIARKTLSASLSVARQKMIKKRAVNKIQEIPA
jgi:DNA-directed RNA polymerase specialized sigma24 family protein